MRSSRVLLPAVGLAVGLALALLAGPASAATYYVRGSGSDGNSGLSPAAAWRTVVHAATVAGAGDVVYVGGGTYSGRIRPSNDGTAGAPVRFEADVTGAFTGDAGVVVLTNNANPALDVSFDQHQHWIGFTIRAGSSRAVSWQDSTGGRLEDCVIENAATDNVYVDDADLEIRRCVIRNGSRGIRIDDDADVTLVNVVVADNSNDGIDVNDETVRVTAWHLTVANNGDDGIDSYADPFVLRDSIVVFSGDDGLAERGGGTIVHSDNIVHGNGGDDYNGTGPGTGEIDADPLFVAPGAGDYHLDGASPAVDAGIDSSALTTVDLEGTARPQGGGFDMGAYETGAAPHFAIAHDGAGVACEVEPVTITRHQSDHSVDTAYTGTVVLSTDTGNGSWSLLAGAGTLVNAGGGGGSYSFVAADAGQVVLGFLDAVGETVDIDVTDGSETEAPSEDPALLVAGVAADTYRDDFTTVSWANQNGSLPWSGSWIEVDSGSGPGGGNAFISGGELVLEDYTNTDLAIAVQREADLSAHSAATLAFDFRTTGGVDSSDGIFVEVSSNGGATWSLLERIGGLSGAVTGSRSYDISAWIASNTRIRLRVDDLNGTGGTSCCYGASNEEFRVAFLEITVPAPSLCGPDHFEIAHDGAGVNCQAENVTITAHDASHNVDSSFTGTISLATSTGNGDWSLVTGAGVLVNAGGGGGTYTYAAADAGRVVLGLRDSFSETLSVNVTDGTAGELEDPPLSFASTGFSFLADGVASTIGTQIGGKPSSLAPGDQALELEAIRTSDATGACEAALTGGTDVELAFTCQEPGTCAGAQVSVNGTPIAANPAGAPAAWTTLSLDFGGDTDTTAPFWIAYPDVGRIQLHARYALAPSGETLAGASNAFVVRPFAFEVTAAGNPGGSTPGGPIFTAAGADFTASARAVLWEAGDDLDADGLADGHGNADPLDNASLADNLSAASYGREAGPEGVELGAVLVEPAGGSDPGLGGTTTIGAFVAGTGATAGVFFDEVGVAELSAEVPDGDWLGIGAAETALIAGRSGYVGRFTPDRLDVGVDTAPVLGTTCAVGGYSYVGEHFDFATAPVARVTARSARGSQTRNYTGAWWRIDNTSLANRSYAADPGHPVALDPGDLPPTTLDPTVVDLGDGTGTLTFTLATGPDTGLRFDRAGPTPVFDADIALSIDVVDLDGVAYPANPFSPVEFGAPSPGAGMAWSAGASQRYGRLALTNAFGSEQVNLPVPLRAEFWTGTAFALHGSDACTVVTAANVGTVARSPAGLATGPVVGNVPLVSGDAGLFFTAPGSDGFADVRVNLGDTDVATPWGPIVGADLPWLRWDWSGDGAGPAYDEDPGARITFGIYGGDAPVIFRREIY